MPRCECCGMAMVRVGSTMVWPCLCTEELLCRTCNHCAKHCQCDIADQVLDVPLAEQLAIAKHEFVAAGGRL